MLKTNNGDVFSLFCVIQILLSTMLQNRTKCGALLSTILLAESAMYIDLWCCFEKIYTSNTLKQMDSSGIEGCHVIQRYPAQRWCQMTLLVNFFTWLQASLKCVCCHL